MKRALVFGLICLIFSTMAIAKDMKVSSPDGTLTVTVGVDGSKAWYQVMRGSEVILDRSALGLVLKDGDLQSGFKMGKVTRSSFDETWNQPWGEDAQVRNHYNEMKVRLQQKGRYMDVAVRAYDDGVALRYEYPRQAKLQDFVIIDELTQFAVPVDAQAWSIPALTAYYEGVYTSEPLSKKGKMSGPVALEVNDSLYMAIMDANLTDYSTMNFDHEGTTLKADLVPWQNGDKVRVGDTRVSPWRAVIIGRKAADILLSRLALNLNEPCKIADTSWLKPSMWAFGGACRNSCGPGPRANVTVPRPNVPKAISTVQRVTAWAVCWSRAGITGGTATGRATVTSSVSPRPIPTMTCRACASMPASAVCASLPITRRAALRRITRTSLRKPIACMSRWASIPSRRAMSTPISITASCSTHNGASATSAKSSRPPRVTT